MLSEVPHLEIISMARVGLAEPAVESSVRLCYVSYTTLSPTQDTLPQYPKMHLPNVRL